jgi:hypothetical protein
MATAPEPFFTACLRVLYSAVLEARLIGYAGTEDGLSAEESKRLADLADAVHNLPDLLRRWEEVNEPLLRGMLADFDRKWGRKSKCRLLVAYEETLKGQPW